MPLTRYGFREWFLATIVAVIIAGVFLWLTWWWAIIPIAIVWIAFVSFFRDPIRRIPSNTSPGDMISPADGVVSAILHVDNHPATEGPAVVIRIFLSVLNVHVNRAPCSAEIIAKKHTPGKYINAQLPESADVNEQMLLTLKLADPVFAGETVGLKLIAGMIARRIVSPLEVGSNMTRGEKIGMIKFGSTAELILPRPEQVKVHVKLGDKVKGGMTFLAHLPPRAAGT